MGLQAGCNRLTFQYLLDLVDSTAWSVEFVTEQLVGGAGGIAEATMNAATQDPVSTLSDCRVKIGLCEIGFHA
jgi:hypothetical protein